jgi:pimeloyl-ACP methyl ester carboxylesterase
METNFSSSQTTFASINNWQIAYRKFGKGTPVLFYNRFRGVLDTWDPLFMDALAAKHEIILFDYPGIGDSEGELSTNINEVADMGIKLMDHLGFNTFHVTGWSYGGLVAQAALFTNKTRIQKAVFIGTNPPGNNETPFEKIFFEHALKPSNDLDDEIAIFFEPTSEESKKAAKASHDRIAKRLDASKIPAKQEVLQKYFGGSAHIKADALDFRGQYKTITNPVLVISSDHDASFAVENWFPLLRKAPSMQHLIINDTGHGLQHQHPELIAGYMNLFLL